jgi:transcriptional regulator with XRE-family HTH domain
MVQERKSSADAKQYGATLRQKRKSLSLTLQDVAAVTGLDVGQLSRFERGEFRAVTPNLQKFAVYLQNQDASGDSAPLIARFTRVMAKSDRHMAAAQAMVAVLESLR